jgi:hypothetical protein
MVNHVKAFESFINGKPSFIPNDRNIQELVDNLRNTDEYKTISQYGFGDGVLSLEWHTKVKPLPRGKAIETYSIILDGALWGDSAVFKSDNNENRDFYLLFEIGFQFDFNQEQSYNRVYVKATHLHNLYRKRKGRSGFSHDSKMNTLTSNTMIEDPLAYCTDALKWILDRVKELCVEYSKIDIIIGDTTNPDILDKLTDRETDRTIDNLW